MKTMLIGAIAVLTGGLTGPVVAAGGEGQELFKFHGCINCHGAEAKQPVSKIVPVLAGKPQDELYTKAKKILSGEGETEGSKLMHAALYSPEQCDDMPTDTELTAITTYIASVPKQ